MIKKIFTVVIIVAIVVGGGFYAFKQLMPEEVVETQGPIYSTQEVIKGDISVGVEVSGQLDATNGGGIRAPGDRYTGNNSYIIDQFLVEEGDKVTQGQVLVTLLSDDISNKIRDLDEQIELEKKNLSQMTGVPIEEVDSIDPTQGIQILAPIDGSIVNLQAKEGQELSQGQIIARVVDNSKFKISCKLTTAEFNKVEVGDKVAINFPYFDGFYEGEIKEINSSPIPNDDSEDGFGTSFVYMATVEGNNPGLIQPNMEASVGLKNGEDISAGVTYFMHKSKVEGYADEEKVLNQVEAVATEVHVKEMQNVKKGDPIITMSGSDVREMIEDYVEKIRKLNSEKRDSIALLDQLEIRSPMDGVVGGIYRQPGETVSSGDWLGDVYNTSNMRMWTEIDDVDMLQVKQEAPVKVTVDALPNEKFEGKVERVSTMGRDSNGATRFSVTIQVNGGPQLKPGMQARAYIDAGSAEDVLLIPLEAIFEEDGATKVEILNQSGVPEVKTVKLGLMNDRYAEVVSGLNEGDDVITGSTDDLLPSQHIKSDDTILPSGNNKDENQSNDNNNTDAND